ncbi:MAG: hypothetical protein AAFO81_07030 [Pseudomonadota bacterium]
MSEQQILAGRYGCDRCFPDDLELLDTLWFKIPVVAELISESHFSIKVRRCGDCRQRFVTVFAETIDWENGEDPQQCSVLPITEFEAARLLNVSSAAQAESLAGSLGSGRRSFLSYWPSNSNKGIAWATGLVIGMHD